MKCRAIRMKDLKHVAEEFNTSKNDFQELKDKKIKINNLKHDTAEFKKAKLDLFNKNESYDFKEKRMKMEYIKDVYINIKVDADSSVKIIYYGAMLNPYKSDL
ncbi:hypothetical protein QVD17_16867 [Tagetes erecta]|uniref:Uncharacterized protein n=1 Tax=Tagetes erecta TaxID=13708 RepID=A0AAD8NTU6_TARER|nr:hypothetical protein QVD17_16867 [Tagetes erecta]